MRGQTLGNKSHFHMGCVGRSGRLFHGSSQLQAGRHLLLSPRPLPKLSSLNLGAPPRSSSTSSDLQPRSLEQSKPRILKMFSRIAFLSVRLDEVRFHNGQPGSFLPSVDGVGKDGLCKERFLSEGVPTLHCGGRGPGAGSATVRPSSDVGRQIHGDLTGGYSGKTCICSL